jgi:NIMA-interacting peptidyl-prolyl cis-trans isomerase 1
MHIVVKHAKSRRPASWRSDNITRSPEEAEQIVLGIRNELINLSGDELKHAFAEKAKTESDCNSAQRGGDLGHFGRGQMQPAFEEVAFALQVGQLSDLVQTDSGVHVILRTE